MTTSGLTTSGLTTSGLTTSGLTTSGCFGTWDESKKVIVLSDGHTFARGLTKTLAACFSPEFSTTVALQGTQTFKPKKNGKDTGNAADLALSDWVVSGIVGSRQVAQVRRVLVERGWVPVASQVPLGCSCLRLGTKLDLLCKDRYGDLIVVELKCGFDDYYCVENQGNMLEPFQDIPASFRNKHFVQLLMTCWLLKHSRPTERIADAFLLRLYENQDGAEASELLPLPDWARLDKERMRACVAALKATKHQTLKRRRAVMESGSLKSRLVYGRTVPCGQGTGGNPNAEPAVPICHRPSV